MLTYEKRIEQSKELIENHRLTIARHQNDLEKAEKALESVKKNAIKRVYYTERGWVWEPDEDKIQKAQERVDFYKSLIQDYEGFIKSAENRIQSDLLLIEKVNNEIAQLEAQL